MHNFREKATTRPPRCLTHLLFSLFSPSSLIIIYLHYSVTALVWLQEEPWNDQQSSFTLAHFCPPPNTITVYKCKKIKLCRQLKCFPIPLETETFFHLCCVSSAAVFCSVFTLSHIRSHCKIECCIHMNWCIEHAVLSPYLVPAPAFSKSVWSCDSVHHPPGLITTRVNSHFHRNTVSLPSQWDWDWGIKVVI